MQLCPLFVLACVTAYSSCIVSAADEWEVEPMSWNNWSFTSYTEAVRVASALNDADQESFTPDAHQSLEYDFDFPALVMNMPSRPDRRAAITNNLRSVGFSNVSFPPALSFKDLDWDELVAEGMVDASPGSPLAKRKVKHGVKGALPFAANAINWATYLRSALDQQLHTVAIFEDDLIVANDPWIVNRRIGKALEELPLSADMMYMELCFERCSLMKYSEARPGIARASFPHCAAALIFKLKGIAAALNFITPAWNSVDTMFGKLVQEMKLEAYIVLPLPFHQVQSTMLQLTANLKSIRMSQDGIWGSDVAGRASSKRHIVNNVLCNELKGFVEEDVVRDMVAFVRVEGQHRVLTLPRNSQYFARWLDMQENEVLSFYTQRLDSDTFNVHVGPYQNEKMEAGRLDVNSEETVELFIPSHSRCHPNPEYCLLEIARQDMDGGEVSSTLKLFFIQERHPGASDSSSRS